jgi:uncharacterized DUF497 family protein
MVWSVSMEFEYDPAKSASNKDKHGIDFEEAKALWKDDDLFEIEARSDEESRFFAIGQIGGVNWTAVYTIRNGRLRMISVRRSRTTEVKAYEANISD